MVNLNKNAIVNTIARHLWINGWILMF